MLMSVLPVKKRERDRYPNRDRYVLSVPSCCRLLYRLLFNSPSTRPAEAAAHLTAGHRSTSCVVVVVLNIAYYSQREKEKRQWLGDGTSTERSVERERGNISSSNNNCSNRLIVPRSCTDHH